MNAIDIRTDLIGKLTVMFSPPSRIETPKQAQSYLAALAESFLQMRPTDGEWEHIWGEFIRTWDKVSWPLPSELPRRLTAFRVRQASVKKAAGDIPHEPGVAREIEHRPYNHGEFMAAVRRAREMAASDDPFTAALGRSLSRCADGLLRNRDDQDRPRYAEAAE